MFEMSGEPREPLQNALYEPVPPPDLSFLDELDMLIASTGGPGIITEPLQRPSTDTPGLWEPARTFTPTPTGRRQRGQLEAEVLLICNKFMNGEITEMVTPQYISTAIDPNDPPSVGAINAIFYRWEDLGFIRIHRKPLALIRITNEGVEKGLEYMKQRAKRSARK